MERCFEELHAADPGAAINAGEQETKDGRMRVIFFFSNRFWAVDYFSQLVLDSGCTEEKVMQKKKTWKTTKPHSALELAREGEGGGLGGP